MSTIRNCRGVALLEFAVVIPLVFLLFFGAIETSRGIAANNEGVQLARETAVAVFHECKDKNITDETDYTKEQAEACLRSQLDDIHRSFAAKRPRSAIVATIYQNGPGGAEVFAGPITACVDSTDAGAPFDCTSISTRFPVARAKRELASLLKLTKWTVVVETFLKTDSVIESALNPLKLEERMYYAPAVM
ncbi:MAG: TadE family protein [Bdellovibrionota bacterium]